MLWLATAWSSSEDWTLQSFYGLHEPLTVAQKVSLDATLPASYAPHAPFSSLPLDRWPPRADAEHLFTEHKQRWGEKR